MPKKTRKEKQLAMYHKKLRLLEKKEIITPSIQTKIKETSPAPSIVDKTKADGNGPVNKFFYSDLRKSILLVILILGIVVSLYFMKLVR